MPSAPAVPGNPCGPVGPAWPLAPVAPAMSSEGRAPTHCQRSMPFEMNSTTVSALNTAVSAPFTVTGVAVPFGLFRGEALT